MTLTRKQFAIAMMIASFSLASGTFSIGFRWGRQSAQPKWERLHVGRLLSWHEHPPGSISKYVITDGYFLRTGPKEYTWTNNTAYWGSE